jgi:transposase InsO family protein
MGWKCSRHRVARLMRHNGVRVKVKNRFRVTTQSRHSHPVAANLLERNFTAQRPNEIWAADITYIWTREGWLYLAVVMDVFSRRIVGWSLKQRLTAELALDALQMALSSRRPPRNLIHHSDRGSQYASGQYGRLLAHHGILPSMSRAGDCWDNAMMESLFGRLKTELVHLIDFQTRAQAHAEIFEYIESFYNRHRRHSSLGYLSPAAFEAGVA